MTLREIQGRASMGGAGDWSTFYGCILFARQAYVSLEVIRELTYLACLEAGDEAAGAEYRFSPFSMTQAYLANTGVEIGSVDDVTFADVHARGVLLAVIEGRDRAVRDTGTPILLRAGLSRSFEIPSKYEALEPVLIEHADAFVGLDVLGKGSDA